MSEQKSWFREVSVQVTAGAVLLLLGAITQVWPKAWSAIARFFTHHTATPLWLWALVIVAFLAITFWGFLQYIKKDTALNRLQEQWEEKIGRKLSEGEVVDLRSLHPFFKFKPRNTFKSGRPMVATRTR